MPDLLTRLAQTALGKASVVLPLERSAFAPPRRFESAANHRPEMIDRSQPVTATERHLLQRSPTKSNGNLEAGPTLEQHSISPGTRSRPAMQPEAGRPHTARVSQPAATPTTPPAVRPTLQQVMQDLYPARRQEETAPASAIPVEREPRQPRSALLPSRRSPLAQGEEPYERAATAPPSPAHLGRQVRQPQPLAWSEHREQPNSRGPGAAMIGAESSPPQPDVHINIGRIELKAASPPLPPVAMRSAPGNAHLSLNDYLERRRRGRI